MTPLTQALTDYLAYQSKKVKRDHLQVLKCHLSAFLREVKVSHVEELTPYIILQFVATYEGDLSSTAKHRRSAARTFLVWCRDRYFAHTPQIPIYLGTPKRQPHVVRASHAETVAEWQRKAEVAAGHMVLPHQRAIFLLGYLYGYQLKELVQFGSRELHSLSENMRGDLYDTLAVLTPQMGPPTALFQPWLGRKREYALRMFREWVPDTTITFYDIVHAGQVDRARAGMAPRCEKVTADVILASLPGVSKAGLERMKRFW